MNEDGREAILFRDSSWNYPMISHGQGVKLYSLDGRAYFDGCGGPFVVSIGHGVREIADAMKEQAERLAYAHTLRFVTEPLLELSQRVLALAPPGMTKVFWVNSGSEATEAALRIARMYHLGRHHPSKYRVVGRWGSYHGATLGATAMGGRPGSHDSFGPSLPNFPHIPPSYCFRCPWGKVYPECHIDCAEALDELVRFEGSDTLSAVIAEPIPGSYMGIAVPPPEYFPRLRVICDRNDILFIADEVMTGFGRTGKVFGIDHWGVIPDLMTIGKGVTSGYAPLAGVLIHERVSRVLAAAPSSISGHTYGANPVACAAGVAVLDFIEKHGLFDRARDVGAYLFDRAATLKDLKCIADIRGKGLLMGIELAHDAERDPASHSGSTHSRLGKVAFDKGLYVQVAGGFGHGASSDYVCLAPPFVASKDDIDEMLGILRAAVEEVYSGGLESQE
jgi:adenosylmethionine-8-amino-7-oxononanoate aminotransferase